jgi:hypothetical protein
MTRERMLKVLLVLVGLLFTAMIYPVTMILWHREQSGYTDAMMGSLYVTLGILLLRLWQSWPSVIRASTGFFRAYTCFFPSALHWSRWLQRTILLNAYQRRVRKSYLRFATLLACLPRAVRVAFGR